MALLLFFPIFWMVLTSFKSEVAAIATPPQLFFTPDAESYAEVQARANYLLFAMNSVVISARRHAAGARLRHPRRLFAMAFHPTQRTRGTLLWMLSTKMLPPVGVLVPIYLMFRTLGLLDTRSGPDRHLRADEPADRGLDAVHLLQGGAARRSWRPAAWTAPAPRGSSGTCCCR